MSATALTVAAAGAAERKPAPSAKAAVDCEFEALDMPGESDGIAVGVDSSGSFVLGHEVLWRDGEVADTVAQSLHSINSSGLAVGTTWGEWQPYAYQDGQYWQLPGAGLAEATDVNDEGTIVGTRMEKPDSGAVLHPLVWPDARTEPVELDVPDGKERAVANAIDSDGTVYGYARGADGVALPYKWSPDGVPSELPLPSYHNIESAWITDASAGWVVGVAAKRNGMHRTLRWSPEGGEPERVGKEFFNDGGEAPFANVGANGWVLRPVSDIAGRLTVDGETVQLPVPAGYSDNTTATDVSDNGHVVGRALDQSTGRYAPAVWTCQ